MGNVFSVDFVFKEDLVLIPYIVIDDHSYDGNHINDIIDLTYKGNVC